MKMHTNPLHEDPERERRIRERAYHLWQSEGRPHGRDVEYWERARALIGMEDHPDSGRLPNPQAEGADPSAPEVIEDATVQENYGEIPGRLTDQGDRPQTPAPRKARNAEGADGPVDRGSKDAKARSPAKSRKKS
jgi:hypothetical protein